MTTSKHQKSTANAILYNDENCLVYLVQPMDTNPLPITISVQEKISEIQNKYKYTDCHITISNERYRKDGAFRVVCKLCVTSAIGSKHARIFNYYIVVPCEDQIQEENNYDSKSTSISG